jgi:hypothetical protein
MEPIKILKETKLPSECWNRAYEMGRILLGENAGDIAKYGVELSNMRLRADDPKCMCHEGLIYFIKKRDGLVSTKHILHIIEESGKNTFTIEIFEDHSDTDLMFQEFGVKEENIRETVFREAGKIREMFFAV